MSKNWILIGNKARREGGGAPQGPPQPGRDGVVRRQLHALCRRLCTLISRPGIARLNARIPPFFLFRVEKSSALFPPPLVISHPNPPCRAGSVPPPPGSAMPPGFSGIPVPAGSQPPPSNLASMSAAPAYSTVARPTQAASAMPASAMPGSAMPGSAMPGSAMPMSAAVSHLPHPFPPLPPLPSLSPCLLLVLPPVPHPHPPPPHPVSSLSPAFPATFAADQARPHPVAVCLSQRCHWAPGLFSPRDQEADCCRQLVGANQRGGQTCLVP
jgi:hypothetical protein